MAVGPETQVTAPQVAEQAEKSRRRLLESHKKGGSCRGRVQRGSLWVLQVLFWALFWACPDSTEAPDGFWSGQMLQPVAGCGCCGACWFRRCSAGPSGRSSGEQRASSGASSSFLALQGRAWGLARKDYGTGGRKIQAWAASESLLEGQDVSRLERQDRRRYRERMM
ncbi:hypothetical protein GGI43DRAFT_378481 [Trichoderma evansii]